MSGGRRWPRHGKKGEGAGFSLHKYSSLFRYVNIYSDEGNVDPVLCKYYCISLSEFSNVFVFQESA